MSEIIDAHPDDILVVAWIKEAEACVIDHGVRFRPNQVFSTNAPGRLCGRRFRRAYAMPGCGNTQYGDRFWDYLRRKSRMNRGASIRPVRNIRADYVEDELAELLEAEAYFAKHPAEASV